MENRKRSVKTVLAKAVYWLSALIMAYYACRLLLVGMLHFDAVLICCIVVTAMTLLGVVPRVAALADENEKRAEVRRALTILFAFYIMGLVGTLFVGRVDGSMCLSERRAYWAGHWNTQVNLEPLRTVKRYIGALSRGVIPRTSIRNLLGNMVLMAPMGLLAPWLFKKLQKPWRFILLITGILVGIEALQLVLCCGVCDVDDVFLNLFGALIVYFMLRLPPVKRLLVRLYILPPPEAEKLTA